MSAKISHINALNLTCPEPLTLLRNAVRKANPNEIIEIESNDPVSLRDIPAFCNFMGHKLLNIPDYKTNFTFVIQKKSD